MIALHEKLVLDENALSLLRLIGSFMVFASIIMVVYSFAQLFSGIEALSNYPRCIKAAYTYYKPGNNDIITELRISRCKEYLYANTGIYPEEGTYKISLKQKLIVAIKPLFGILFWAAIFFVGTFLYNVKRFPVFAVEKKKKEEVKKR